MQAPLQAFVTKRLVGAVVEQVPELGDPRRVVRTSTDALTWSRFPESEFAVNGEGNRWIGRLTDDPEAASLRLAAEWNQQIH